MEELSLFETDGISNQQLNVVYTPSSSVAKYSYEIIKNNETSEIYSISTNKSSVINLFETGNYQIVITEYDYYNKKTVRSSGNYRLDLESPILVAEDSITVVKLNKDQTYSLEELGISATDVHDGKIDNISCDFDNVDFTSLGLQKLTCSVADQANNVTTKEISINVITSNVFYIVMLQFSFILILLGLLIYVLRFRRSLNYEKVVSKYSLKPINDRTVSLFDQLLSFYKRLNKKLTLHLNKSQFLTKYSKKYHKYLVLYNNIYETEMQFISTKLILGTSFILVAMFSKLVRYEMLNLYEFSLPFVFGFFLPDIIYWYRYKLHHDKLENDLLQGIIIMNNAFKSGRSITQAVELVSKELKGPMALEFGKMYMELNFGLSVDVVFGRLAERINLEEVSYLTASLTILNRTGGNIIKVFTSIENNLFSKKRLKLELRSLTGSSKLIMYVLYAVPALFILFISLISPTYFKPFYTTTIGIIMMFIMSIIYIAYVWFVQKIMKVRM
ncbi:MAG: type II secretion system F family protein [Bacilli bacterium]|nr:type II secretion system F family protein [Bacilli bacterium]